MRRRQFITLLGGAAAWPLAARAQQPAMPIVGFVTGRSAEASVRQAAAFRKGLNETGTVEGQNVTVEYYWLEGQYDRLPALMADLVRRQVAVMATVGNVPTLAAKAATATIPIVFGVGDDPVRLGLVASFAWPGGNATGINFLNQEVASKRLRLLHELVPNAVRVAVLVNPANAPGTETALRIVQEAAPTIGLQIQILKASTSREIDAAFATIERERPDALFVSGDAFFISRAVQLAARMELAKGNGVCARGELASGAQQIDRPYHHRFHPKNRKPGERPPAPRSNNGVAPRSHMWGATPCIKIEPNPEG